MQVARFDIGLAREMRDSGRSGEVGEVSAGGVFSIIHAR